jgi:hypothetical protein
MKTPEKKTIKKLSLNKATITILSNIKQLKLIGGDGGPITGQGGGGSQPPKC